MSFIEGFPPTERRPHEPGSITINGDFRTTRETILMPGVMQTMQVSFGHEQPGSRMFTSTRSKFAQLGVSVNIEKINNNIAYASVAHHGKTPILVHHNTAIGRTFMIEGEPHSGLSLYNLLSRGEISIQGTIGRDYILVDKNRRIVHSDNLYRAEAIGLPFHKIYAKPAETSSSVLHPPVDHEYEYYRHYVSKSLPHINTHAFAIGETDPSIQLSPRIHAILDPRVDSLEGHALHINSRLLEGGVTNFPIRLEMSAMNPQQSAPHQGLVYMSFYNAK